MADSFKKLVIFPGGFNIFTPGHNHVYKTLVSKFHDADVYIAASNDTSKRPFNFVQKQYLASQAGVPPNRFVQVKSPYKADEITYNYNPESTVLIFALSSKDAERLKPIKKDGSLSYLQPYPVNENKLKPMIDQGYYYVVPQTQYNLGGEIISSASTIREKYQHGDEQTKIAIIKELYPKGNVVKIKKILDEVLPHQEQISESPNYNYSQYNDRENDLKKLHWQVLSTEHGISITIGANSSITDYTSWSDDNIYARIRAQAVKNYVRIGSAYIKPEWSGTGLGQMMYDKLIAVAKNDGYKYVKSDYDRMAPGNKAWVKLAKRYPVEAIPDYVSYDDGSSYEAGIKYYQIDLDKVNTKINEFHDRNSAPINFNPTLNPKFWEHGKLIPVVAEHLKAISENFIDFLDTPELKIIDITISGSNAAYTYTDHSDIDLHIVVEVDKLEQKLYKNLFDAKKNLYNDNHSLSIYGQPVELYVQFTDEPHVSEGLYSLIKNKWIDKPQKRAATLDDTTVKAKIRYYVHAINDVIDRNDLEDANRLWERVREYRKDGLSEAGEYGSANIVFKLLRQYNYLEKLNNFRKNYIDRKLSLESK